MKRTVPLSRSPRQQPARITQVKRTQRKLGLARGLSKVRRPRRWACAFCPSRNEPGKRKCVGCGVGRATRRTSLRARADGLWRRLIVGPDPRCRRCGAKGCRIEAAHIIGRRNLAVRFDLRNGLPLCAGPGTNDCHRAFDSYRFDREAFIEDAIGKDAYRELRQRATVVFDGDYVSVIAGLKKALEGPA